MNSDLKQRYIYAAVKNLPRAGREDIQRELSTLIDDLVEERCGEREPTEKDLRVVLTELGTPAELYKKYDPNAGKVLIGPEYYPQYKLTRTIVLCAAAGGVTLAQALSLFLGETAWYEVLLGWLGSVATALAYAFTIVTLLFMFFEKKKVRLDLPNDTIENLPPVPNHSELIPRWESIAGLALCVVFIVVFLAFPQVICVVRDAGNHWQRYTVFNVDALRAQWVWIVLFGLAGLVRNAFRLMEGRYSARLMAVTLACNLVSMPLACLMLLRDGLLNPTFSQVIRQVVPDLPAFVYGMFDQFHLVLLGVILFALALDTLTDVVQTLRVRRA